MSDLTPLDILGVDFPRGIRGYDTEAVRSFLQQLASSMEELLRERGELRQNLHRLEQELAAFKKRENALQEALIAAQKTAEATMDSAKVEAQQIIQEGHALADRLVDEAYDRAKNIETTISVLRSRRREVRGELMRLTELLQGMIRDDQQLEQDERSTPQITVMPRREGKRQA
ncbi:MAG: DivIVA domain-containing protein [Acidobacteriota bacterium]